MTRHSRSILLLLILAVAALTLACGNDDPTNPGTTGTPDIELATARAAGSFESPDRPLGLVALEFGVDSELLPVFVPPDTLLFSDREFDDNTNFTARASNTPNVDAVAVNLTNGVDGTAYAKLSTSDGSNFSISGPESGFFTYAPGLTLGGPDLDGYTVTAIRVNLDLDITPVGPQWRLEFDYTITILGH